LSTDPGSSALLVAQETRSDSRSNRHDDVHFVADVESARRMVDPAPGDVGDVQQTVDAAEIDEETVVGDVLVHDLLALALLEALEGLTLLALVLLLQHGLARQDDVVAPAVEADDLELEVAALQALEVLHRLDVGERTGQEGADADVDGQAALDAIDDPALDDAAFLEAVLHVGPDAHARRLGVGEQDVAFEVLGLFEEHFHVIAHSDGQLPLFVVELGDGDQTFRLVADVDHHGVVGDRHDPALDDLAFGEVSHALVVQSDELLVGALVLGAHLLIDCRALLAQAHSVLPPGLDFSGFRLSPCEGDSRF
jgi:hypothetical protein